MLVSFIYLILFCFSFSAYIVVILYFNSVGKAGFDSPAKLVGRPPMRVPPYLSGFQTSFPHCF